MSLPLADALHLIQTLNGPALREKQLHTDVLRLDRLHPVISGNKWLKLQPWLAVVQEKKLNGFLTKGGPYSNHLHAAAYAALLHNYACTIVVKAPEGMQTPTLFDIAHWKANILYAPTNYDDDAHWQQVANEKGLLFIPMGGEGPVAVQGVATFISSLQLPAYDYVLCPVGTGTTLHGIALSGLARKKLMGINPGINDDYNQLLIQIAAGSAAPTVILRNDELKKFGKHPEFLPALMAQWQENWHLETDIVYTAKMVYQFLHMLDEFEAGSRILLVHTGGLQGNRSYRPKH